MRPNPVMDDAAIGLTPIFPVICVVPVFVIPDFARIAKLEADPISTVEAPITLGIIAAVIRNNNTRVKTMEISLLGPFFVPDVFCFISGFVGFQTGYNYLSICTFCNNYYHTIIGVTCCSPEFIPEISDSPRIFCCAPFFGYPCLLHAEIFSTIFKVIRTASRIINRPE